MSASAAKIAFIDGALADANHLIDALGPDVEVVLLQGGDGLDEMAEVLKDRSDLDAIMVFSHGQEGQAVIGQAELSAASLDGYAEDLAVIGGAMGETGDLLLYGCDVGAGASGRALVDGLALATGADVAASDDATGAASLGGDWDLETRSGDVAAVSLDTAALRDVSGLLAITSVQTLTFDAFGGPSSTYRGLKFPNWDISGSNKIVCITKSGGYYSGVFYSVDQDFDLISLKLSNPSIYSASVSFKGYSSSNSFIAGASYATNVNSLSSKSVTFGDGFNNVYAIVATFKYFFYIDDLTVGPANAAPVIGNLGGDALTYYEGSGAQVIDQGAAATVTDSDSTDFNTGTLTVSIVSGGDSAEDALAIRNQGTGAGQIGVSGANVTYGGTAIGTFAGGSSGADLVVTLNANCTVAAAQSLVENITYANGDTTTPTTGARTVNFTLTDGDGGSSATKSATVTVVDVNDPPTLSTTASNPSYVPGGAAATLFSGTSISTIESGQSVTGLTLSVTGLHDGVSEILVVDGTDVVLTHGTSGTTAAHSFGYSVSITGSIATVTLSKTDSVANWQTLVNGLAYRNDATNPTTTGGRSVNLSLVTDDGGTANGGDDSGDLSKASIVTFAQPSIASAAFDWSTGALTLTGTNFLAVAGAANDVIASQFSFLGQNNESVTLSSSLNVEITSATTATITLSAGDLLSVRGLLNKNGTTSSGGATYNLDAADDWMAASPSGSDVSDASTPITVSNVAAPTISSATYDAETGLLTVTGTNFFAKPGATNDVDLSALTFTGQGGANYTLTTATDVEIDSATQFQTTLTGVDKTNVDALLDKFGATSSGGTTYNLAAADHWLAGADPATDIGDAANGVTVSIAPRITSATYNATTGVLVVTGTNFQANGGGADIDVSKLTLSGEGGAFRTLTTAGVEIDSATQFTVTLSAADKAAVNQILNKNGTTATGGATFNLAAADDWDTAVTGGDASDATNGVTVSNVAVPAITNAAYDAASGRLVVTGTGFLKLSGATNDIDVSKLTLSGEGGAARSLTSDSVEITSDTSFTVDLNAADQAAVNLFLNKNGTTATGGAAYNLAAAEDWAAGADAAVVVADPTGNGVTVSNVAVPTITSAAYNSGTGLVVVTGTGFLSLAGGANDIDASLFTFKGEAGGAYTLTDTADVDVTSGVSFSLTLSATDKAAVNLLLNKDGTLSQDNTLYNLAAAEDWAAGADAAATVADAVSGVTVTLNQVPVITSNGGGATAAVNVAENTTAVTTVAATDPDLGDVPSFSLTGGADQALFTINAVTGALVFLAAPDFENPTDGDTDNVYEVEVTASDGKGGTDSQALSVTVTDVAEGGGGGGGGGGSDDGDGASSSVESQVPGLQTDSGAGTPGDGNGDGKPDSQQADVTSVSFLRTSTPVSHPQGAPTAYITLVADSREGKVDASGGATTVLRNVQQLDAPADRPSDVLMPFGMLRFTAETGAAGATESFSLYVDEDVAVNGYWKRTGGGGWVNLASAAYGGQVVTEGGKTRLDFTITDGGPFDSDGVANGSISDPGAIGWREQAAVFNENHYLQSKLTQLQTAGETGYATAAQVKTAIEAAGLTCQEHFRLYSLAEGTDPDAFFDTSAYLAAKANQLNGAVYEGRSDWNAAEVKDLLAASGFTNAYDHFAQYGWLEDVNPSNSFDVSSYLATKAAQCGQSVAAVTEALRQCGLDPISHYALYGQNEAGVTVAAVGLAERT